MRRFWMISAAFLAAVAFTSASVWAQARGGGGQAMGGGGLGGGGLGSGGGLSAGGFGASAMGGGGLSGGGLTGGGLGGSRAGGGLGSTGARGGSSGMFGNRSTGSGVSRLQSNFRGGGATGQGRFAGMGLADATQGFTVGGRREGLVGGTDVQNFMGGLASGMAMGGLQGGGRGGFQQQGRGGRGNQQQNNQGRNGRGRQQQRQVRTVLEMGFSMPPRNQSAIATTVAGRLAQSRGVDALSPVTVTMNGRVAVLQGVVPTDHARNLAEQLALLEPGVSTVQNDLTIAEESSESSESASATAVPPAAARPSTAVPPTVAPPTASPPPAASSPSGP